jgi:uncharacterized membrane protein YgcG
MHRAARPLPRRPQEPAFKPFFRSLSAAAAAPRLPPAQRGPKEASVAKWKAATAKGARGDTQLARFVEEGSGVIAQPQHFVAGAAPSCGAFSFRWLPNGQPFSAMSPLPGGADETAAGRAAVEALGYSLAKLVLRPAAAEGPSSSSAAAAAAVSAGAERGQGDEGSNAGGGGAGEGGGGSDGGGG